MKAMSIQLPECKIGNHRYLVDFQNGEFRMASNPSATIAMRNLPTADGSFIFRYDNRKASVVTSDYSFVDGRDVQMIALKASELDPGFFKKYSDDETETRSLIRAGRSLYNQTGGIHSLQSSFDRRPRLLPMVNLYGTDFLVDLVGKELRQADNPSNRIPWQSLKPKDNHYMLLYNAATKKVATEDNGSSSLKLIVLPPVDIMVREGIAYHKEVLNRKVAVTIKLAEDERLNKRDDRQKERMQHSSSHRKRRPR